MSVTLPASERDQRALWAVVGANVVRKTVGHKALAENLEHVLGLQSSLHPKRQTFSRKLINEGERSDGTTVVRLIGCEWIIDDTGPS
jgi:hypothetical protein